MHSSSLGSFKEDARIKRLFLHVSQGMLRTILLFSLVILSNEIEEL
jgi:hypothetical protein